MSAKRIFVWMEGGIIQDVNIPEGLEEVEVVVRDYDIEGMDAQDERIEKDKDGDEYVETIWSRETEEEGQR
jgi:hypothetical protein